MNMHLGESSGESETVLIGRQLCVSIRTAGQHTFPEPLCWPFWSLALWLSGQCTTDSGLRIKSGRTVSWRSFSLGLNSYGSQISSRSFPFQLFPISGWEAVPSVESAPVENRMPLSGGEHVQNVSLGANSQPGVRRVDFPIDTFRMMQDFLLGRLLPFPFL